MKSSYFPYIFIFLFGISSNAFSQKKPIEQKPVEKKADEKKPAPPKGDLTEEIEVVRPYKPVLADASKIRRSPDLTNTKPFKPNLTYNILDKRLELNSDLSQLQAQEPVQPPVAIFKNNYAKAGAGNFGTGLGELYINTGADEALQAGMYVKHLNLDGNLSQQKLSHQRNKDRLRRHQNDQGPRGQIDRLQVHRSARKLAAFHDHADGI